MKRKHHGLICLSIFTFAIAGLIYHCISLSNKITADTIRITSPVSIPDIKIPDDQIIKYIDYLTPKLSDIALLKKNGDYQPNLTLFGFIPVKEQAINDTTAISLSELEEETAFPYSLTLCFTSLKNNFCIIDNILYQKNGILPDGGKILKIENDRVLILKHKSKAWIYTP